MPDLLKHLVLRYKIRHLGEISVFLLLVPFGLGMLRGILHFLIKWLGMLLGRGLCGWGVEGCDEGGGGGGGWMGLGGRYVMTLFFKIL